MNTKTVSAVLAALFSLSAHGPSFACPEAKPHYPWTDPDMDNKHEICARYFATQERHWRIHEPDGSSHHPFWSRVEISYDPESSEFQVDFPGGEFVSEAGSWQIHSCKFKHGELQLAVLSGYASLGECRHKLMIRTSGKVNPDMQPLAEFKITRTHEGNCARHMEKHERDPGTAHGHLQSSH